MKTIAQTVRGSRRYGGWGSLLACIATVAVVRGGETPPTKSLDASIAEHRTGTLVVKTAPGARVEVEQLRHEFWFGAALSSSMFGRRARADVASKYRQVFLENFNAAVTENALKWEPMEPREGRVDYSVVDAILEWADANDVPVRGHCLFWGVRNRVQEWVRALDDEALRKTLRRRARTVAERYRGRFAEYDLNNEMLHQNYYAERLGPGITREMAAWVREGDPDAVLFVNDYDVLTGRMVDRYVAQIRTFLKQGVPLGGIGVQGHLHGDTFDPEALRESLDKLAEFRLPIRVTEFNMPGQRSRFFNQRGARLSEEEEAAKAKALVDYYRICFAHPAVEGILMWGFWEGANWIPASSLFRRDWTPTPAARAYRDLVFGTWWTRWEGEADAAGRAELRGFYGKHRVRSGGKEAVVTLRKKDGEASVDLR
jgi:GH35 family endo-1,4-beta-xylanase